MLRVHGRAGPNLAGERLVDQPRRRHRRRLKRPRGTAVVGLSHLGLVTAAAWASLGRPVMALDPDESLVRRIVGGALPVVEPGLSELIASSDGSLDFSSN